jgi:hypothetical protein
MASTEGITLRGGALFLMAAQDVDLRDERQTEGFMPALNRLKGFWSLWTNSRGSIKAPRGTRHAAQIA